MSVGLPVANTNLCTVTVSGRTLTPYGPMTINDGRQRLPATNAAVTLNGATDGTGFDVYAVTALGNAYTLLAMPIGTDMSARADVRRLGTAADFPSKNGCVWQPLPGGGLDAYLYADQYGLHIRPFASAVQSSTQYPTPISGSLIIDPVPGSVNQATVWLSNDSGQAKVWNHVPGLTPAGQQHGMHVYSYGTMAVQAEAELDIYANTIGKINFQGLTIQPWDDAHGGPPATQATIYDSAGHTRRWQGNNAGTALPPSGGAAAAAGTGATATVSGTDEWGRITLTTGTSPVGNYASLLGVSFRNAYPSTPYGVILQAASAGSNSGPAQQVMVDPASLTRTGFSLVTGAAALAASSTFNWYYHVLGQ
jgi:hypothetical protein